MKKVLFMTALMLSTTADAVEWFSEASLWLGAEYETSGRSIYCNEGNVDKMVGNLGGSLSIMKIGGLDTGLKYQHLSCVFNSERSYYDAPGVEVSYKWERIKQPRKAGAFKDIKVFGGVEYVISGSSQYCKDSKGTVNWGLVGNMYDFGNGARINAKYQRMNCFVNEDKDKYEAVGFELQYLFDL